MNLLENAGFLGTECRQKIVGKCRNALESDRHPDSPCFPTYNNFPLEFYPKDSIGFFFTNRIFLGVFALRRSDTFRRPTTCCWNPVLRIPTTSEKILLGCFGPDRILFGIFVLKLIIVLKVSLLSFNSTDMTQQFYSTSVSVKH